MHLIYVTVQAVMILSHLLFFYAINIHSNLKKFYITCTHSCLGMEPGKEANTTLYCVMYNSNKYCKLNRLYTILFGDGAWERG